MKLGGFAPPQSGIKAQSPGESPSVPTDGLFGEAGALLRIKGDAAP